MKQQLNQIFDNAGDAFTLGVDANIEILPMSKLVIITLIGLLDLERCTFVIKTTMLCFRATFVDYQLTKGELFGPSILSFKPDGSFDVCYDETLDQLCATVIGIREGSQHARIAMIKYNMWRLLSISSAVSDRINPLSALCDAELHGDVTLLNCKEEIDYDNTIKPIPRMELITAATLIAFVQIEKLLQQYDQKMRENSPLTFSELTAKGRFHAGFTAKITPSMMQDTLTIAFEYVEVGSDMNTIPDVVNIIIPDLIIVIRNALASTEPYPLGSGYFLTCHVNDDDDDDDDDGNEKNLYFRLDHEEREAFHCEVLGFKWHQHSTVVIGVLPPSF
jgi:hypothetical protein